MINKLRQVYRYFLKRRIIREYISGNKVYIRGSDIDTFVETGTYKGHTANMVRKLVRKVTTIEKDYALWTLAWWRFKECPNVTVLQGDSKNWLPPDADMYFLDAHTIKGQKKDCPLLDELKRIESFKVILIDDIDLFDRSKEFPTIKETKALIKSKWPLAKIKVKNNIMRIT